MLIPVLGTLCLFMVLGCAPRRLPLPSDAEPAAPEPPGKLVDIGGYRLHLNCTGRGPATAILIAGSGDFSFDWSLVQPELSRSMRVCSYDRAGLAWSDLGPVPRTMKQDVYELHLLLSKAAVRSPYVLVGHSLGGLIARLYAETYPDEVAGEVLVDPTHENTRLMINGKIVRLRDLAEDRPVPPVQTMASSPPQPPTQKDIEQEKNNRQVFGPPGISPPFDNLPADVQAVRLWMLNHPRLSAGSDTYLSEELQQMYAARATNPHPLGSMPLIVIATGGLGAVPPEGISQDEWDQVVQEKRAQKADLATLSTRGQLVIDESSGHHVQLDHPSLVIESIKKVVAEAMAHE